MHGFTIEDLSVESIDCYVAVLERSDNVQGAWVVRLFQAVAFVSCTVVVVLFLAWKSAVSLCYYGATLLHQVVVVQ